VKKLKYEISQPRMWRNEESMKWRLWRNEAASRENETGSNNQW